MTYEATGTSRLVAIDATGEARWTAELPARGPGELFALAPLGDGGIAVGQAPDGGGHDAAWIVRFAADGAIRSSQVVAAQATDAARAVAATSDGGFVVAGTSFDPVAGRRGCVWRFDGADQLVWRHTYDSDSFVQGVAALPDGGAVVVGSTQPPGATLRSWIFGIDRLGAQRWRVP